MAADKARFYLEQSVPELREWERKNVFSKEEISSIARKRSDFEHLLNGRGEASAADYARYASYELNLDALRKKREKRLQVKTTSFAGSRRIFFILDRGTRKFPGDLRLWTQYMEFAKKEKAHKRMEKILAKILRLHPTKPELWIWAAKYMLEEQADMMAARGYMQRGLRFCQNVRALWFEYVRLEMIYIAKIAARKKILGLDQVSESKDKVDGVEDLNADSIALPDITAEDINPNLKNDEEYAAAAQKLASTPAMSGAIPIAVFDSAMKNFSNDDQVAKQFFDLVADFDQVDCSRKILQHILDAMVQSQPQSPSTHICRLKFSLFGLSQSSPDFVVALRHVLNDVRVASAPTADSSKSLVVPEVATFLKSVAANESLDPDIRLAITASIRQLRKT